MKFQTFDEAQKAVAAINGELQLLAHFAELIFPARAHIRESRRHGTVNYSLGEFLSTSACAVPTSCRVTYLCPTTQLGMDALEVLKRFHPKLAVRKKEGGLLEAARPAFEKRLAQFADKVGVNGKPKRKTK